MPSSAATTLLLLSATLVTASAAAQATITGPSTWAAGQPTTVTWSVQQASTCASGVRVVVNVRGSAIQSGNTVLLKAGQSTIPGMTVAAGTPVSLSLMDMCSGKSIAAAHAVTVTGSTAVVTPVAPIATNAITPQVRANIDSACQGVLGAPCSTTASYAAVYSAISQKITQGSLKSDASSVMYNYLIPMVTSNVSWETAVVDNAWRGAGCSGTVPESQWVPKVPSLQTYQAVSNAMRAQGCAAAAANVPTVSAPAAQYIPAAQMTAGYNQVWGSATSRATVKTNCPVSTGAASCARADLVAYVRANGTAILPTIAATPYQSVVGQALDSAHAQIITSAYGVNWSGADDLVSYLRANTARFAPAPTATNTTLAGLSSQGCLVNSAGVKLSPNETCGLYYLDSRGAHAPGVYPASLNGHMIILTAANPGGGVMVSNTGVPLKIVVTANGWGIGANIVAQGGGNIVAQGGGNIVAQGGGNIVAQGGGNIVAQGGGNIVAQGGGNFISSVAFMSPSLAASTAGLVDARGSSIISQDGGSFLPAISSIISQDGGSMIGQSGSGLLH